MARRWMQPVKRPPRAPRRQYIPTFEPEVKTSPLLVLTRNLVRLYADLMIIVGLALICIAIYISGVTE